MNLFKTFFLMTLLTALFVVIGYFIGGQQGIVIAFLVAVATNIGSYWFSDKIVLARYRAHEIMPEQRPDVYGIVQNLTRKSGLPMPRMFVIPNASPNAFATGRNPKHAVVAVTQGLLDNMNKSELEGVIAHELAHIKNRHILIGTIAATMAGAIMLLAYFARFGAIMGGGNGNNRNGNALGMVFMLLAAIVAPLAAAVIQMAISRSDEYDADTTGAQMAGNPKGLASALGKLDKISRQIPMQNASDATAHMFIVNPLTAGQAFRSLFSTHPPVAKRIERLMGSNYLSSSPHNEDTYVSPQSDKSYRDYRTPANDTPRESSQKDRARNEWDRLR